MTYRLATHKVREHTIASTAPTRPTFYFLVDDGIVVFVPPITMHDATRNNRSVGRSNGTRIPEFILQAPANVFGRPTSSWPAEPSSATATASNTNGGETDQHRFVLQPRPSQRYGVSPVRFLDGISDSAGFVTLPARQGDAIKMKGTFIPSHPFAATSSTAAMPLSPHPNHGNSRSDLFAPCGPAKVVETGNRHERHQPGELSARVVREDDLGLKLPPSCASFMMTPTPSRNEATHRELTANVGGAKPFFVISPPHKISLLPRKYHQNEQHYHERVSASNTSSAASWVASSCLDSKGMNDSGIHRHDANHNGDARINKPIVLSPSVMSTYFSTTLTMPRDIENEHNSESERDTSIAETSNDENAMGRVLAFCIMQGQEDEMNRPGDALWFSEKTPQRRNEIRKVSRLQE